MFRFRKKASDERPDAIRLVTTESELTSVVDGDLSVVYKHSSRCGISLRALKEIRRFSRDHPRLGVAMIDVIGSRELSDLIEERFDIRHESPQAIVLRRGQPTWDASHLSVTATALEAATAPPDDE